MANERNWFIRNIAEVPWRQFPDHFGGALSKPLVPLIDLKFLNELAASGAGTSNRRH